MRKEEFQPCIPTRGIKVPVGPAWIHEIKHDGYRLIVQRDGARVRVFTRNGYDWSDRFPLIVEAALKNKRDRFVIDGEAVLLGDDGVSDFNGLHSRRHNDQVKLYAFDILALDGDDLRSLPLHLRKEKLARLLAKRPVGIFVSDYEQGEIGPELLLEEGPRLEFKRTLPAPEGRDDRWMVDQKSIGNTALHNLLENLGSGGLIDALISDLAFPACKLPSVKFLPHIYSMGLAETLPKRL
jgi:bifunctional non-homologous end joining protein LigD